MKSKDPAKLPFTKTSQGILATRLHFPKTHVREHS
jgi:hypothetical protein